MKSYGGRAKRKYSSRLGKPMMGRMTGPGRGFKSNFFRLQRAPGMNRELGYVDLAAAEYPLDSTGSVTLLNTIAQGASVQQRVGKKVVLKSLQCRGSSFNNSTATANDTAYMIVYDKRPTGALPNITDILNTISAKSMNNDANAGRFSVLKRCDQILVGNQSMTGAVANALTELAILDETWFLDLKGREVVYKAAATGAIGDIEQGALYLVTVGNTAAGTAAATLSVGFRLRFLDV